MQEEAACFERKKSAAVLVDLVKAFEQVTLGPVWREGIRTQFHPRMLRLALELCAVSRRLVYKRAMSRSTANTLTAILAGLGVASDLMLLKLMKPVDTVIEKFPALNVYVIADDVKLGLHDEDEERLSRTMEAATHELIRLTEEDEHMQVSRGKGGKTVALGSTRVLRQKLGRKLAIKGIKVKEEVSNLGVGFALHKKGKRSLMQTKRWHVARGRKDRIRRLGGRGGQGSQRRASHRP